MLRPGVPTPSLLLYRSALVFDYTFRTRGVLTDLERISVHSRFRKIIGVSVTGPSVHSVEAFMKHDTSDIWSTQIGSMQN